MAMSEVQVKDVRIGAIILYAGTHYRTVMPVEGGIAITPAKYTKGLPPRTVLDPFTVIGCNPTDVLAPWHG